METNKEHKYGTVTVGTGGPQQQDLEVINFVQSKYTDNRLISISELEDNTFMLVVENPASTGRATQSAMRLSKESFMALIAGSFLYFTCKGENMSQMMEDLATNGLIDYSFSDNLTVIDFNKEK
jgi:hypothetical protein